MDEGKIDIVFSSGLSYHTKITINQAAKVINDIGVGVPSSEDKRCDEKLNEDDHYDEKLNEDDHYDEKLNEDDAEKKVDTKKVEDPSEALKISGAQTYSEKIVALAAYLLKDGRETFKPEDVKAEFRRVREKLPGNFSRDLNSAIKAGWVAEEQNTTGEYYLTNKTDGILEGKFVFPRASLNNSSQWHSAKRSSTTAAKPDTLAGIDEFPSTMEDYPGYAQMKSEKDRLLWIATYMRVKHNREGVTNKEVAWISEYIGRRIPTNNISGAFNKAKKPGYAIRSTSNKEIRVTEQGIAYLKTLGEAN